MLSQNLLSPHSPETNLKIDFWNQRVVLVYFKIGDNFKPILPTLFQERDDINEVSKHQSSSIEDLITLFNKEKDFFAKINNSNIGLKVAKLIDKYAKTIDYDL